MIFLENNELNNGHLNARIVRCSDPDCSIDARSDFVRSDVNVVGLFNEIFNLDSNPRFSDLLMNVPDHFVVVSNNYKWNDHKKYSIRQKIFG